MKNLAFLLLVLLISCKQTEKPNNPNFIIIIADDAAWDDSGAYGNYAIQTPNIDKLAIEGMRFDNAYVTTSSCSPSRCSILTGLYPHSTGAPELHMALPADKILLPGLLQEAGYYTVSAGKWHIGPDRNEFNFIYKVREDSGAADWVTALQNRPKDKPFFAWFAAVDPHRIYKEGIIDNPHNPSDVIVPPFLPDNDSTRKDLALYYDEITRLDQNIGLVMEELKKQGIDENTYVIYMTDNGRPFPRCKTRMLDAGLKTPFIVWHPGKVQEHSITESLVSSVDIAPTILELAGVGNSKSFQGISFAPILTNPQTETRDYIIGEHNWHDYQAFERAVRTKDFLYIKNEFPELASTPPADAVSSITYQEMIRMFEAGELNDLQKDCFVAPRTKEELYDVNNDPIQFKNLAENKDYKEKLNHLRNVLAEWAKETNDTVPANITPDMFDRKTGKKLMDIHEYREKN